MVIGPKGQNLLFLISQPRSGSTLLQRLLAAHPAVHTMSEPWLLLHGTYGLRKEGIWTDYDARVAEDARLTFLRGLPSGTAAYFEGLRRMYRYIYSDALAGSGKTFFLDKTPRYYQIIPEIHQLFPEARFIFLFRNPLAVLCSIVRTWVQPSWFLLHRHRYDLFEAPLRLLEGVNLVGQAASVVHYENLVTDPRGELRALCTELNLSFAPQLLDCADVPSWRYGDQVGTREYAQPNPEAADKWHRDIESSQVWRLARDYLASLGRGTISKMGYSYDVLLDALSQRRPSSLRVALTWPLGILVNTLGFSERCLILQRRIDQILFYRHRYGWSTTWRKVAAEVTKSVDSRRK